MKNARSIQPTGIRFPEYLKDVMKKVAKGEGRSLNTEVIRRLEKSLRDDGFMTTNDGALTTCDSQGSLSKNPA